MPIPDITFILLLILSAIVVMFFKSKYWPIIYFSKLSGLLVLTWVYSVYYPNKQEADVFKFHSDVELLQKKIKDGSIGLEDVLLEKVGLQYEVEKEADLQVWERSYNHTGYSENKSYIKFYLLLSLVLGANYWTLSFVLMALALCGQVLIIKSLNLKLDFGVVALFLLPSFLIWNNGLLKESMIVFLLGLIVYSVLINRYYFIFSIPLLILFKMPLGFLAIVFTPLLVLSAYKTKFLYLITGALGLFLLHFLVPQYSPIAVIQNIQTDFINFSQYIQSGSIIPVPDLSKSWLLYPFFAIWGLFNSFFAPFPHHFNGVVNLFVIAENFFVLGLISVATYKLLIAKAKVHSNFIFLLLFVLVYLSILGIITPVAGTLVRYKSPFVFLILAILYKLLSENNLLNFQWKKNSIIK